MLESLNQTLAAWLVLLALVIFSVHTHAQIQGLIAGEEQPNQTLDLNATNETQINETLQIPEQNLTNETIQPAQNETLPEPQEEGQGVEITSEPGSGAQPPPASGPPGSPSSAPPSAPQRASVSSCANLTDNNTVYTLTNNLNQPQNCDQFPLGIEGNGSCIIISGHNVTLDCAGFSITGPGTGAYCSGVLVNATTNVTVKNCNIEDFSYGIGCSIGYRAAGGNGCSLGENHSIFNNTLKDNTNGLYGCFNSSNVTENRFYNNFYYGAAMVCDYGVDTSSSFSGSDNLFRDNVANSTGTGFYMYWDFHHNIFINNTAINGYPPYSTLPAAGFKIGGVVSDYTFRNTSHNTFINNTANNNTIGFWITGNSYNNTLRGNIIKYNNDDGMSSPPPNSLWIRGPYGEEIGNATGCGIVSHWYDDDPSPGSHEWVYVGELHAFNNTIENNTGSGMLISGSNNNITENSIKYNGMYGISLASNITITEVVTPSWGLDNCNITNNTIVGNNWTGIRLHHTRKAFVKNNTVTGNNISGIVLDDEAKWNIIENNSVSNNSYNGIQTGIFRTMHYSFAPSYNVIQNNTITGTGEWSFLSEGYQNNFTGNIIGTLNPTNMSFKDTGLDNDINISGVDNPPATGSLKNISKYVNVTVWGPSNRIFLNVSYTDSDVSGMDEGGLRMCWYNETSAAWELAPVFSDINGVDTVSNTVYAKLEPSGEPFNGFWYTGLYAPLEVTKMPNTTEMILNSTSGNNYTTDNLNCWARGEDEYNLTLGAYWRWWNGSSLFLEGYTSGLANSSLELITTLESGNTSEGETWTCSVFFTNSTRNETDWNNRSIIITTPPNNPPDTIEMTLNSTSSNNYTTDDLHCWAKGSDAENTTLAAWWQWWNGSSLFLDGYTPGLDNDTLELVTILGSGNTSKGETWKCSVLFFDGELNESAWNNRSLTILNTPPGHTQPVLNSSSGNDYTSDDLYCWNQSTSDDDNDPVTNRYRWYKEGSEQAGLENQTVVTSGNTSVGEAWICEVTPYDDEEAGTPRNSSSLTIQSAPPPPPPPAPGGPTRVIPTPNYIINITKYPSVIELLRGDTKTFSIEVRNTGDAGLGDVNVKADSECPGCKFTTSPTGVDMIAQKTRQFLVTVNAVDAEAGIYSLTLTALSEEKANSTRRLRLKVLMCKPGSKKCLGNSVGTCSQDGFSWTPEYCEYGCNEETLACNKPPVIEYPIPPEV
ncbi:MAG: right-handed parallel beta-helix repeat-containing protein, partial [Candidatus Aenigmatarchaeota archaeon]